MAGWLSRFLAYLNLGVGQRHGVEGNGILLVSQVVLEVEVLRNLARGSLNDIEAVSYCRDADRMSGTRHHGV